MSNRQWFLLLLFVEKQNQRYAAENWRTVENNQSQVGNHQRYVSSKGLKEEIQVKTRYLLSSAYTQKWESHCQKSALSARGRIWCWD